MYQCKYITVQFVFISMLSKHVCIFCAGQDITKDTRMKVTELQSDEEVRSVKRCVLVTKLNVIVLLFTL